jgi:hypothetical protein
MRQGDALSWVLLLVVFPVALVGLLLLLSGCADAARRPDASPPDALALPLCADLAGCVPEVLVCDSTGACDCYAPRPAAPPLRCRW